MSVTFCSGWSNDSKQATGALVEMLQASVAKPNCSMSDGAGRWCQGLPAWEQIEEVDLVKLSAALELCSPIYTPGSK